jgi:hypothetical protein
MSSDAFRRSRLIQPENNCLTNRRTAWLRPLLSPSFIRAQDTRREHKNKDARACRVRQHLSKTTILERGASLLIPACHRFKIDGEATLGYFACMATNQLESLSPRDLRRAAKLKEQIGRLEADLSKLLGTPATNAAPKAKATRKKRRRMGAAAKARIAEAQKARWAKWRAAKK